MSGFYYKLYNVVRSGSEEIESKNSWKDSNGNDQKVEFNAEDAYVAA
jgi:hypothetical protein